MAERDEDWTLTDAKSRFSEVVKRALTEGPQTVTRSGRSAVVVVSTEEWRRKTRREGSLAAFFADSPLRDSGAAIERCTDGPRSVDL